MADVFFTDRGHDRLDDLDPETRERIEKKLREIADWPDHFLKSLKGRDDYVLRVGDYRALIHRVGHEKVRRGPMVYPERHRVFPEKYWNRR